jgi:hypothetical protein
MLLSVNMKEQSKKKPAQQMGLTNNQVKTKCIEVSSNETKKKHIMIDNKKTEK